MKKLLYFSILCLLFAQACESGITIEQEESICDVTENEIHYLITATHPSGQKSPETKVVLEGDSPSAPIVSKWQGSTSNFQDQFAILGYDSDGNIAHVTNATRVLDETEDSIAGTFEFTIDTDYWIDDLEYRDFYAFYPTRNYDLIYYSGSDDDKDNWVYKFTRQSGHFEDITKNLFMTGPELDLNNPSVEFQYGVSVLRLSGLCIPGLEGQTISNIKMKSNAIRDAISYRYSISGYYAAGNEICITGDYNVGLDGRIEDNIYAVFYPSSESLDYLLLSVEVNDRKYSYVYSGGLTGFSVGKVYTLSGAELTYKDTSPDYGWYLNPISSNHYLISNAKDFLGFQKIVNGDEDALSLLGLDNADKFESKTIDLVAGSTIDLSDILSPGENWIPIDGFKGTLNGNGSTIVNLFIGGSFEDRANIGLFATIESGRIESLIVQGELLIEYCWSGRISGLVGYSIQSVVLNCSSEVNLTFNRSNYGGGGSMGGVVGLASQSYIIGCCDSSTVTSKSNLEEMVGGVIGRTSNWSTIIACSHFDSTISVSNNSRSIVGGVVGSDGGDTTISACFNSGKISSGSRYGGQIDGGSTVKPSRISSCYYSGDSNNANYGVGINYGLSFDSGTQRVRNETEMIQARDNMNAAIDEWNSNNPTIQSSRRYYVENCQIVFK